MAQQITHGKIGDEGEPLVIIEDFCPFADALVQAAKSRPFSPDSGFYPGHRSVAPKQYMQLLYDTLVTHLSDVFNLQENNITSIDSRFALIDKKPEQLHIMQTIPHYDVPQKNALACVHYLCPPGYGGTSFYRHVTTGYEFINADREENYLTILESDIAKHGLSKPAKYINGDTNIFRRIASLDALYNRALIYRASSLHSGNIAEGHNYNFDPQTGRLTMTSFIVLNTKQTQ